MGTATHRALGQWKVWAEGFSYFSRLADSAVFTEAALVELHRRGTERAGVVVAPMDGAEWRQAFLDYHRSDAVRILDFPHAVEHLAHAAQAVFGVEAGESATWLTTQAHTLQTWGPPTRCWWRWKPYRWSGRWTRRKPGGCGTGRLGI